MVQRLLGTPLAVLGIHGGTAMGLSSIEAEHEFVPLTDSLASRIRWRACDYASIIAAELELILGVHAPSPDSASQRPRAAEDELNFAGSQSQIRLFNHRCYRRPFLDAARRRVSRLSCEDEELRR
jgi:hypothetical protein